MITDETMKNILKDYLQAFSELYSLEIVKKAYKEFLWKAMDDLRKERKNVGNRKSN